VVRRTNRQFAQFVANLARIGDVRLPADNATNTQLTIKSHANKTPLTTRVDANKHAFAHRSMTSRLDNARVTRQYRLCTDMVVDDDAREAKKIRK
jgi:hypothetical protein